VSGGVKIGGILGEASFIFRNFRRRGGWEEGNGAIRSDGKTSCKDAIRRARKRT